MSFLLLNVGKSIQSMQFHLACQNEKKTTFILLKNWPMNMKWSGIYDQLKHLPHNKASTSQYIYSEIFSEKACL